ncbi:MAG: efflux RND transporter periplasmic adaptor subunit [Gemmatimonadota bacterium]
MQRRSKIVLVVALVVVAVAVASTAIARNRNQGVEVRTEVVERRDLVEVVTSSGNVRARRTVDMSSDISAKVTELLVQEGNDVVAGQTLLRLEPDQYRAALSRAEAQLAQARSQEAQQRANLIRSERDLERLVNLSARDSLLVSPQQLDDARTNVEVARATLESAVHGVSQAVAAVDEAADRLSKTVFTAPMTGRVTRLNVEEGETVIIGTMNNPGSLVLTISDLSVMEAVVRVDETDVPRIALGDSATIRIDAFPDRRFTGRVTEVGNSAITPPSQQAAGQQAAIDFEVVLTLDEPEVELRPDLSATADIVVATRDDVLAIPIIALTVRAGSEADSTSSSGTGADAPDDQEGVFVVREGRVRFVPVDVGITGREHFEVLSGLEVGDTVVAGPYQAIRALSDDDPIRPAEAGASPAGGG